MLVELGPTAAALFPRLLKVATGVEKTDVPAATIGRVLEALGPPPKDRLGDITPLLGRKDYKTTSEALFWAAGEPAVPVLIEALKADDEAVRAAAATLLGRAASLGRNPPVSRTSWRLAMDALAATKGRDKSPDVRAAAGAALVQLTRGGS
jgi:hypothetical protein